MKLLVAFAAFCVLAWVTSSVPIYHADAQTVQAPANATEENAPKGAAMGPDAGAPLPDARQLADRTATTVSNMFADHPIRTTSFALIAGLFVVGVGILLYYSSKSPHDPFILKLGPSFFFWLGIGYMGLLLLMAVAYSMWHGGSKPALLGDILPIAVPWFGALGAVAISLEGVFIWNKQWDDRYNYWHIGRPLFGAVLGIVAFFLYVLVITASGTPPEFLKDPAKASAKDFIIFYIVAFLVGYREETFRELIKRVTDLILKSGTQPVPSPAVTFKVAGMPSLEVGMPATAANAASQVTVEVQNTGNIPLTVPAVAVSAGALTPDGTFGTVNDQITGGNDLAPGAARTVDVTFQPAAAGDFSGTLTVTATNLAVPRTIRLAGTGQ